MTELLTAPPATTYARGSRHNPQGVLVAGAPIGRRGVPIQTATQAGEMEPEGIELALRRRKVAQPAFCIMIQTIQ